MATEKTFKLTVLLRPRLAKQLQRAAESTAWTMRHIVELALEAELERLAAAGHPPKSEARA